MARSRRLPANYFKFVNPIIISLIGVGMYLLLMAWLDPKNISTTYFGRIAEFATWLGTENNRLMKQILLAVLALHIFEALVGVYICHKRRLGSLVTVAWTLQNLILGFASLYYLIWPQKPKSSGSNASNKKEDANKNSNKGKDSKNSNKGKNASTKPKDKNHATKSRKEK